MFSYQSLQSLFIYIRSYENLQITTIKLRQSQIDKKI